MKINRVFLGTCEPSYFVREKGYEVLREAGIEVYIVDETGVAQGNCARNVWNQICTCCSMGQIR